MSGKTEVRSFFLEPFREHRRHRMTHHKRKKTRRSIKCSLCTPYRWRGNARGRFKEKDAEKIERFKRNPDEA